MKRRSVPVLARALLLGATPRAATPTIAGFTYTVPANGIMVLMLQTR